MGRPTYGSARMVYVGWPQLQQSSLDRKYSRMQVWASEWETTLNDEKTSTLYVIILGSLNKRSSCF